jgi:ribosome-associated protein
MQDTKEVGGLLLEKIQDLVKLIAGACEDEKAIDVTVLNVHELTVLVDYFVIASGRSIIQVKSIVEHVEDVLEAVEVVPLRRAGHAEGKWVVLDYGSIMVHVFRQEEREYYNLENLWGDAQVMQFEAEEAIRS